MVHLSDFEVTNKVHLKGTVLVVRIVILRKMHHVGQVRWYSEHAGCLRRLLSPMEGPGSGAGTSSTS